MKKTILLIAALSLVGGLSAQRTSANHDLGNRTNFRPVEKMLAKGGDYTLRLEHVISSDEYESSSYSYNAHRQLVRVHDFYLGEYDVIDSLHYDAQGHMVRLAGWQLLNGVRKNVYYIDYGYNEQGLISSRENYNLFGEQFEMGGRYDYTYNADGQIVRSELTMGGSVFYRVDYEYENGKLLREVWRDAGFSGSGFTDSEVLHYYYDANGKNILVLDSIYSEGEGWNLSERLTYAYDENGNMTEYHSYDGQGSERERRIYYYDNRLLETTLMPYHPEMLTRPLTYTNHNLYTAESYWMTDVDFVLQYLCDYDYYYVDIDAVGVVEAQQSSLKLFPNPASNEVTVEGLEGATQLYLYDAMGRLVKQQSVEGGEALINVSNMAHGVYVVRLSDGRSSRLVVK